MKIILASASPRRDQLLQQVGISCTIQPSQVEETITKEKPWEVVEELSFQKAMDVAARCLLESSKTAREEIVVIGADTIVAIDGEILGKPKDAQEAKEMLGRLQGKEHQVYTGVTLVIGKELRRISFHEETKVSLYPMSMEEVEAYVATGEPMDKAGAYGIQGKSAVYIEKIQGDYNNVVGLPLARLYQEAKKLGYDLTRQERQ